MRHIGLTQSGTVLVEMTIDEWQNLGAIITDVELLAQQVISHRALTGMNQEQFAFQHGQVSARDTSPFSELLLVHTG